MNEALDEAMDNLIMAVNTTHSVDWKGDVERAKQKIRDLLEKAKGG